MIRADSAAVEATLSSVETGEKRRAPRSPDPPPLKSMLERDNRSSAANFKR